MVRTIFSLLLLNILAIANNISTNKSLPKNLSQVFCLSQANRLERNWHKSAAQRYQHSELPTMMTKERRRERELLKEEMIKITVIKELLLLLLIHTTSQLYFPLMWILAVSLFRLNTPTQFHTSREFAKLV
jgi:hypothetical protein